MANCQQLHGLLAELDDAERRYSSAREAQVNLSAKIEELVRAICAHREAHAGCDFKPLIQ